MKINPSRFQQVLKNTTLPGPPSDVLYQSTCVFLLLFNMPEPHLLAILKADNEGYPWRNQVALPGGHLEKDDASPVAAAYRELKEELTITKDQVELIGSIGHFQTTNNRDIEVFVGLWQGKGPLRSDSKEIERVLEIPLQELLRIQMEANFHGHLASDIPDLTYPFKNLVIWGVTARILHYFIELFYPLFESKKLMSPCA